MGAVVPGPAAAAAPAAAADALTVEQLFPGASQGALDTEGELRFTHRVFLGAFCSGRQPPLTHALGRGRAISYVFPAP